MSGAPDDGARLVETGSFQVDRARALEKLRTFRSDAVGPVPLFVRAAVAAGARNLRVAEEEGAVTLSWDGAPLPAKFFDDPYRVLFVDSAEPARAEMWAARGLLHAFGPGVSLVSLESGDAPRRRLVASELGQERAEPPAGGTGTLVRLEGSPSMPRLWAHPLAPDGRRAGVLWPPLSLVWLARRRELIADDPPTGLWETADAAGRLRLVVPEDKDDIGAIRLYVDGVLGGRLLSFKEGVGAAWRVEVPDLRFDASLESFSKGPETEAALARVAAREPEFVARAAAAHAKNMAATLSAMRANPWLERLWLRRLRESPGVEEDLERLLSGPTASAGPERAAVARAVVQDAQTTLWLRRLFAAGKARAESGPAPLALGPGLEAVTAESLRLRRRDLCFLPSRNASVPSGTLPLWEDGAVPEFWAALRK